MMRIGWSVLMVGVLATPAVACDLCSIYSASMANGGVGTGLFGGVAENYTYFGTLQDSGHKIPNDGEYIKSSTSQLFVGWNFSDRFNVQFNIPIIYRAFGSDAAHGTVSGIGDVSLIGNYTPVQLMDVNYTFNWNLLGGIKFPTGDPSELGQPDFAAGIGGHDLALGSGSYDGIVGTGIYARWKRLFFNSGTQYAIRTEGAFQHQYANDLTWNGGPGVYVALEDEYTLAVQAVVSGEYKGKDTFAGVPDEDSAETIVYVGPQVNFTWGARVSVQAGVDLPVSIYNSGVQVVPDYRAHAALTLRF